MKILSRLMPLVIVILPVLLQAQDIKQVLLTMRDAYENSESVHITMTVRVSDDSTSSPYFVEKADIKKNKESYRYQFGSLEMLFNEKYLIMVDHEEKEITFAKRDVKAEANRNIFQVSIDSLLSFHDAPVYNGRKGDLDEYQFLSEEAEVVSTNLFVHATTGMLRRIEYHYKEGQFAAIDISVFDNDPDFDSGTFQEQPYFTVVNKKIIPGASHKDYELVRADVESEEF